MHQGASTVGEINAVAITRDMFRVYGQHAAVVVGTSAIIQFVALLVSLLAFNALGVVGLLVWLAAMGVAYQLSMGVFTFLLLHLRHGHDVPSPSYLLKEASGQLLPLLWLAIVTSVCIVLGFVALIVPGIYLTLRWAVASPALVAKRSSAAEAMRVSAELTKGHKGTVWVLAVIAGFFTNGVPRIIQSIDPMMAMENQIIMQAVIAAVATPVVGLATAELFLRLARVPNRIVPGAPLGGPAPAPAGPYVPTAAIPTQAAPAATYVSQPAPATYQSQPAPAAYVPGAPGAAPMAAFAAPPAHPHGHAPQPAATFAQAPQMPVPQAYVPPAPPAAPQAYVPPAPPAAPQAYVPPAAPSAPPAAAAAPPAYAPPGYAPPARTGPSIAPPGLD